MKKAVFLTLILTVAVFAQGRGYGGFMLSYMMPDLSQLSSEFQAQGLPAIKDEIITYGGGGWGGGKHLMMGGWGFGGGHQMDNEDVSVQLIYGGGFFEPGYFINIWRGLGIMPSVGIGGTSISLKLRPKLGDVDFDSLLVNPARTSEISYSTFTVAPSLTIFIPIEFIAIQIKGGYMYSPFSGDWELEDGSVVWDAPEMEPSGIYASAGLLFGGGGN